MLVLEADALDGRQKFSKLLSEKALVVELTIGSESAAALATQMAKDLGAEIDREAAALLAEILNGEPARIRIELEKLATYVQGRRRDITRADVEALVVAARKNTVWQLADMLASRKRDAALAFLDNLLREGEQPVGNRRRARVDVSQTDRSARPARRTRQAFRRRGSSACVRRPPKRPFARRTASRRRTARGSRALSPKPTAS